MGLVSAGGEAPVGGRGGGGRQLGRGSSVWSPAGGTLRAPLPGLPRSAQSLPAPLVSVPASPQLWLLEVRALWRVVPRHPPSPAPSVPVLASPALSLEPVHFASASVAALIHPPFPGVRGSGAPKEGCGPRESGGCTLRGRDADTSTTSCRVQRPRVPQAARRADCSPPEAGGCAAAPGRGRTEPGLGVLGCARAVPL